MRKVEPVSGEPVELVPLGLVADELAMSRGEFEYRHAADVVRDDIGLRCVPAAVARRIITERDEGEARRLEDIRRRDAEAEAQWRPPVGIPAVDGLSAVETVLAGADAPEWKRVSPGREWLDSIGSPP
jgi:hypothetical protein